MKIKLVLVSLALVSAVCAVGQPFGSITLISSPDCGTINFAPLVPPPIPRFGWDSLSFDPQEGDVVYSFDNAEQRFQIHAFMNGAWASLPRIGVAASCFVQTTQPRTIRYTGPVPF